MMGTCPRYALYYVPPAAAPLYAFGAGVLGRDAYTGAALPLPAGLDRAMPDWQELTQAPRVYGFHATLKAPFRLAADRQEPDLRAACAAFAGVSRVLPVIEPVVDLGGDFAAVVPARASEALAGLAADCVQAFDPFRAPLSARDRERRNLAALTSRQVENLERWGYPYVGDDFRFHMTLTGSLPAGRRAAILALLRDRFAALGLRKLAIDRLTLLRQDAAGSPFRIVAQWILHPRAIGSANRA